MRNPMEARMVVENKPFAGHEQVGSLESLEASQQVREFLEANTAVFAGVREGWSSAKSARRKFMGLMNELEKDLLRQSIEARGGLQGFEITFMGGASIHELIDNSKSIFLQTKDDDAPAIERTLQEFISDGPSSFGLYSQKLSKELLEPFIAIEHDNRMQAMSAYVSGYRAQHDAMEALEPLLGDAHLFASFVDRTLDLADKDAKEQWVAGLLETFALHLHLRNAELHKLFKEGMTTFPGLRRRFARELIGEAENPTQGTKRKALGNIAGTQLLAKIITEEYGHPLNDLIDRVAARFSEYNELNRSFSTYQKQSADDTWRQLREVMRPYIKLDNLPPVESFKKA